jgi:membrane-bound metal-dependent hydrolase YbcI (DUF457 family)
MNGQTHLAIGLLAAHVAGAGQPEQFILAGLGSLMPDIDGGGLFSRPLNALLPRIVPRLPVITAADGVARSGSSIIRRVFGHRGMFHWPLLMAPVIIFALSSHHPNAHYLLWFVLGYLSHIYADACTVRGVPLEGPFNLHPVQFLPKRLSIPTGGWIEGIILWAAWGSVLGLVMQYILRRLT